MKLLRYIQNALAVIVPRGRQGTPTLQLARRSLLDKMGRAYVRCVAGEENMNISFSYRNKQSSLNRPQNEALEKALARIQCTLKKHLDKEVKKRKKMKLDDSASPLNPNENDELNVSLISNDNTFIDVNVLNEKAWRDGAVLSVGEMQYEVCRNFPSVLRLYLPSFVLVGCPVFPRITTEFVKEEWSTYQWFRQVNKDMSEKDGNKESSNDTTKTEKDHEWLEVGQRKTYTPTLSDVGSKLKLLCTPKNGEKVGEGKECVTMRAVKCGPEVYPFQKRHEFTKNRTSPDW